MSQRPEQSGRVLIKLELRAMEERGAEAQPFLQGMLNRLTFGKQRYPNHEHSATDMAETAILSIIIAQQYNCRERMVDAANYCYLAYRQMDVTPPLDGDGPGVVESGYIVKARGRFTFLNGTGLPKVLRQVYGLF